jgi:PIN domain nuclease of toxin-antitoxin system
MILDTCALLWLAQGSDRLSEAVRRRIDAEPAVYVSATTGFEITIKTQKGKLKLPAGPSDWLLTILEHHDLQVLPLDLPICIRAAELPRIHSDPCDRLIIATAEQKNSPVVTADPVFQQYGIEVLI